MRSNSKTLVGKLLVSVLLSSITGSLFVGVGLLAPIAEAASRPQCHGDSANLWVNSSNNHVMHNNTDTGVVYAGVLNAGSNDDVIVGTENADIIHGNSHADAICSLGGDDVIDSGNHGTWIDAGNGNDSVSAGNGVDFVNGGPGYDACDGGHGFDIIINCEADGHHDDDGIILIKKASPHSSLQNFPFTGNIGNFSLQIGDTKVSVQEAGTYNITESAVAGWHLNSIVCSDPNGNTTVTVNNRTASVHLGHGEVVTCTFTNALNSSSSSSSSIASSSSSSSSVASSSSSSSSVASSSSSSAPAGSDGVISFGTVIWDPLTNHITYPWTIHALNGVTFPASFYGSFHNSLTLVSSTGDVTCGIAAGNNLTGCTSVNVPGDAHGQFVFSVVYPDAGCGPFHGFLHLTGDADESNNNATVEPNLCSSSSSSSSSSSVQSLLELGKWLSSSDSEAHTVTYSVTVANTGAGDEAAALLKDLDFGNQTYVSNSGPLTCSYDTPNTLVVCNPFALAHGASLTQTFTFGLSATCGEETNITNSAVAYFNGGENKSSATINTQKPWCVGGSSSSSSSSSSTTFYEYGDAPDSYKTLLASNGARHAYSPDWMLGHVLDTDTDGAPSVDALGDDNVGSPVDEDGVTFSGAPFIPGGANSVTVFVTTPPDSGASSSGGESMASVSYNGYLGVWADWNRDGDFLDPGERFIATFLSAGSHVLTFNVPAGAVPGLSYMRFRWTSGAPLNEDGIKAFGELPNGEVEDYTFTIQGSSSSSSSSSSNPNCGGEDQTPCSSSSSSSSSSTSSQPPEFNLSVGDPATGAGGYHGARTDSADAIAGWLADQNGLTGPDSIAPGGFGGDNSLTTAQLNYICALQRTGFPQIPGFLPFYAATAAQYLGLPVAFVQEKLTDKSLCAPLTSGLLPKQNVIATKTVVPLPLDANGFLVSGNPFWNKCFRADILGAKDYLMNPDLDKYGFHRPCSYYKQTLTVSDLQYPESWLYKAPDGQVITVLFNRSTKQYNTPAGYEVVTGGVALAK